MRGDWKGKVKRHAAQSLGGGAERGEGKGMLGLVGTKRLQAVSGSGVLDGGGTLQGGGWSVKRGALEARDGQEVKCNQRGKAVLEDCNAKRGIDATRREGSKSGDCISRNGGDAENLKESKRMGRCGRFSEHGTGRK
eukprot:5490690-Pleurochrysis_carterae.AAC.1